MSLLLAFCGDDCGMKREEEVVKEGGGGGKCGKNTSIEFCAINGVLFKNVWFS